MRMGGVDRLIGLPEGQNLREHEDDRGAEEGGGHGHFAGRDRYDRERQDGEREIILSWLAESSRTIDEGQAFQAS
jgi:hypothetical protein